MRHDSAAGTSAHPVVSPRAGAVPRWFRTAASGSERHFPTNVWRRARVERGASFAGARRWVACVSVRQTVFGLGTRPYLTPYYNRATKRDCARVPFGAVRLTGRGAPFDFPGHARKLETTRPACPVSSFVHSFLLHPAQLAAAAPPLFLCATKSARLVATVTPLKPRKPRPVLGTQYAR